MEENIISQLSPHLFWDVEKPGKDNVKNRKFIVQRVLEYGLLSDWTVIQKKYGISQIARIAMGLKELDDKSLSFISSLSKTSKKKFRCYITQQSTPRHWNF